MTVVQPSPSPGWYPDPEGRAEKRWWDGSGWTGNYAPTPPSAAASMSTAPMQLTSLDQLSALPSGPGYASLLASLPPVPAYVEQAAPAAPAYATAPPPMVSPAATPFLAIAATPAPDVANSSVASTPIAPGPTPYAPAYPPASQQRSFVPPTTWSPPAQASTGAAVELHPQAAVEPTLPMRPRAIGAHAAVPVAAEPVPAPAAASIFTSEATITAAAERLPDVFTPSSGPFAARSSFELSYVSPSYTPPALSAASPLIDDGPRYEPFAMIPQVRTGPVGPPQRAMTSAAWIMSLIPLLTFGAMLALVLWLPDFYSRFAQVGLLAIFVIASLALAISDSKELTSMGHSRPASAGWIVLSPVAYLLARGARTSSVSKAAFAPFAIVVATIALLAGVIVAVLPEWVLPLLVSTAG